MMSPRTHALAIAATSRAARSIATVALATLALLGPLPSLARAHDGVDRARALLEQARFEDAYAEAVRAEGVGALTRADLIALLAVRGVAAHALGDAECADEALRDLAAIAPRHALGAEVNPQLRERFDRIRAEVTPLSLVAREDTEGDPVLRAEPAGDAQQLVRTIRVWAILGDTWRETEGELRLDADALRGAVRWYAEALGPGGAVLARRGSREEPMVYLPPGVAGGDDPAPWIGLGIGVGVALIVLAVVIGVVVVEDGQRTTAVELPMIDWDGP